MPRSRYDALPPAVIELPSVDRHRPAPEQIYSALRRAILRLELHPGAPVAEAAMALRVGVSRTPVREAMRRLREEGLVEVMPNLGSFVTRLSLSRQEEAVTLRRLLEGEAAARLANRIGPWQPVLRRLLGGQEEALAAGRQDVVYALDEAFHGTLFEAAGLPLMWESCRIARAHMERVHHAAVAVRQRIAAAVAAHAAILDAIEAGDPEAARAAMASHIQANAADLDALRRQHPDWIGP
ncbi:GntR family transcriptional regulator [Roseomonas sp. OT10]|uniref:GntR family transcriptional regulator n=1 Tax=Roseomonas cutis TaxID=2897332 RepID=UPI001E33E996|nr:GntR family transcriptional regulator [Roseomonas sp. OT10]UFN50413.1 GntR family transcriptional regulator [Roseomonas sp. OT10]